MGAGEYRNRTCPCGSGMKFKACCLIKAPSVKLVSQPERQKLNAPGVIVLMPSRGKATMETLCAVTGHMDGALPMVVPMTRRGVEDARNELVTIAQRIPEKSPIIPAFGWYVLWVDDDAWWGPGSVANLMNALIMDEIDIAAGYFCVREPNQPPTAWRSDGTWPKEASGELIEAERIGFHFVMHRLDVFEKLGDKPFAKLGTNEPGEDFAFCHRARAAGLRIWVHTGVPVAHVDDDGQAYVPYRPALRVFAGQLVEPKPGRTYDGPNAEPFQELLAAGGTQ